DRECARSWRAALFRFAGPAPRPVAPRTLNEHTGDQRGLREEERRRGEDVGLVALPDAGLTKPDEGACGNARFADVPSLKLAPVELIGIEIPRRHGDAVSPLAAQHPDRQSGHDRDLRLDARQTAAD